MIEIKHRLTHAVLRTVDADTLTGADLTGANLAGADLTGANLAGADLTGANLAGARMPGFPDGDLPGSLKDAALRTRDWLAAGHWVARAWIKTPTGAYAGDCLACLHGAAAYVGGPEWGPQLSAALDAAGYTVEWNDKNDRTQEEVCDGLTALAATL